MAACKLGCKCGRHFRTLEQCENTSKALMGHAVSEATREKIRQARLGSTSPPRSLELRQRLSRSARARESVRHFRGGDVGDMFATVLLPVGYVREYWFYLSGGRHYNLDFAHVEAKINIELDGPYHYDYTTREDDEKRDSTLRRLGWKIIRIRHDRWEDE